MRKLFPVLLGAAILLPSASVETLPVPPSSSPISRSVYLPLVTRELIQTCDYFREDFTLPSAKTWQSFDAYATWSWLNGKLDADQVLPASTSKYGPVMSQDLKPAITVGGYFTFDTDVEPVSLGAGGYYGIYLFASELQYVLPVEGKVLNGVGLLVFSNGAARLFGWDSTMTYVWSSSYDTGGSVNSIGIQFSAGAVTMRINRTSQLSFTATLTAQQVAKLDQLTFWVKEAGTHIRFDNACASSLK